MLLFASVATTVLIIRIVLMVLMVLAAGVVIVLVMKQPSNSDGTSAMTGASENTDSFYAKNSAKRTEHRMKLWTIIMSCVLAVCSIVFFVLAIV